MHLKKIVIPFLLLALNAEAITLGAVAVAGNGCYGSAELTPVSEDRYEAPIRIKLYKNTQSAFERKTCNFRLPVTLKSNEKLQIRDLSHAIRLSAAKGAEVTASLEVSLVGKKTPPLLSQIAADDKMTSLKQVQTSDGLVAESECGRDTIVTGNLSIVAKGATRSIGSVENVLLTLKVVPCE